MGNCNSYANATKDIWKKYGHLASGTDAGTYGEIVAKMVDAWNDIMKGGIFTIGPRKLVPGETKVGHLVGGTERLFISVVPTKRPCTVRLTKTNGRGGARVQVCGFDEHGGHRDLETYTVNDEAPEGRIYQTDVPENTLVAVKLEGTGGILRKLDYQVSLKA